MEAATHKARLRQQILNGEQDIDVLSGGSPLPPANSQQYQQNQYQQQYQQGYNPNQPGYGPPQQQYGAPHPAQNQQYSNYDLMTPLPTPGQSSSRKASLTSQSTMNRFFRRKGGGGGAFDEDTGADIQDLAAGNVSFDDITHIRANTLDTTPIIPTLGAGLTSASGSKINNVQYRKHMNHQKKVALATGARANSLAAVGNPMQPQPPMQGGDPRAMSLSTYGPGYNRAMTLNSNLGPNGPRTMSLNNRGPGMGGPPIGMGNMQMGGPMGHMNHMGPNGPRTASMRSNGNPMNQFPPNGYPQGPRAMSLNTGPNQHFPHPQQQQQHPQFQPKGPFIPQVGQFPNNSRNQPPLQSQGQPQMPPTNIRQQEFAPPAAPNMYQQQHSNDSLSNVLEEEEETVAASPQQAARNLPTRIAPPSMENAAEPISSSSPNGSGDDVSKYEFDREEDNPSLSRKSTIKKSNSMRLRKINLFDNNTNADSSPVREANKNGYDDTSPSFNIRNTADNRESLMNDEDDDQNDHYGDKFKNLGATASASSKEVFVTAPNLVSPKKVSPIKSNGYASYDLDDSSIRERGSPEKNDPWSSKKRSVSIQSLVANTAFNNFRGDTSKDDSEDLAGIPEKNSHPSSDKSSSYRDNFGRSTPSTDNTSNLSTFQNPYGSDSPNPQNEGYTFDDSFNDVVNTSLPEDSTELKTSGSKKDKTRHFSLTGKSKNLFKRLSKSSRRSSAQLENDDESVAISQQTLTHGSQKSVTSQRRLSGNSTLSQKALPKQPLSFTKEELGIMNCNNDLLNELQLVTTELASSIKRELRLEVTLKNSSHLPPSDLDLPLEISNKSKTISELQEKLNKERRLRFISEEHALLLENGQTPSALKLNYEKTELYQQLLLKNDLVNQLEDKLEEYERNTKSDGNLLDKYNELLRENAELKFSVIPELEKRASAINTEPPTRSSSNRQLSLVSEGYDESYDESQEAIQTLTSQREELREVVSKLTSNHNYELKSSNDKIRALEHKLQDMKAINDKLSRRLIHSEDESNNNIFSAPKGGKLNGFTIVSPIKRVFDE